MQSRNNQRWTVCLALLLALFVLVACGGDEATPEVDSETLSSTTVPVQTPISSTEQPSDDQPADGETEEGETEEGSPTDSRSEPGDSADPERAGEGDPDTAPSNRPASAESAVVLPAPLYFLSNGQIQRLETDGTTLTQLTQEPAPITSFDVSPTDARLVYVTDNILIEANPQYGSRIVKVTGETVDRNDSASMIADMITTPFFSPDGRQITFGQNGVQIMPTGEALTVTTVLTSDPYPDPNNPPRSDVRFYRSGPWSPDQNLILVPFSYWPEAGGLVIVDVAEERRIDLAAPNPNTPSCCDWAWSRTGGQGFIASDLIIYGTPGLAAADASSGEISLLVPGQVENDANPGPSTRLFRSPHQDSEGNLFVFASESANLEQLASPVAYQMTQVEASGDLRLLRRESYATDGDILWSRDGSGAALVQATRTGELIPEGSIFWLAADGSPAVSLPAEGTHLRWGPSATQPDRTPARTDDSRTDEEEEASDLAAGGNDAIGEDDAVVSNQPILTATVLLNVRSGPSTAYPIVGELTDGEQTDITGVSPDSGWWQIVYPTESDSRAWVISTPDFSDVANQERISVVTPPPLPRPVGRIFYSAADADGQISIFAQSLAPGATPSLILSNASQPSLLRDSQQLAVRSNRSNLLGLGIYDLATDELQAITSHLEDTVPNWSPNGERLVFASTRHGDRRWRIYTATANGITTADEVTFGNDPDWHSTQDLIVYKGCDDVGESCGLWTMDSAGVQRTSLTSDRSDSRPVWSPDGRTIVFMSEARDGNWEIYTIDATGSVITRLTNDEALDGLPTVSPDGSRVAFISNRGGGWGIWVVSIDGGTPQSIVDIGGNLPNWLEQGLDWGE